MMRSLDQPKARSTVARRAHHLRPFDYYHASRFASGGA
jgi:hypothetical protein